MINIDNLNELSLYEVDLLIKQIENSPEREDNLQKVMDRRNEIINTSKLEKKVPEDISKMSLKELYEQRELLNDNGKKELDGKVVAKAKKEYANGKGVILTAEELYILRDLLGKASDNGYNGKDIKNCKQKVKRYIDNFEDYYGINKQLLPPEEVQKNLETIKNNIPSVKDLLNRKALENVKNVLDNLVITGEQGVLSQKNIKGEEAEKIKNLWMEKVYQETTMYLANTKKEKISDEVFAQEFSDRMKLAIVQAIGSKEAVKVAVSNDKDKVQNSFKRLIKNLDKSGKKVEIDKNFLVANLAKANIDENAAITRLSPKYAAVADIYKGKNKELDEKCKKQHKTLYTLLKTAAKSGAWGVAYGVGAAFGPLGVAAVASASFIKASYDMYKDYKNQKKDDQTLDVVKYMKKNPTRVAGMVLSTATAAMGIGSAAEFVSSGFTATAQVLIRGSAISLGAANVVKAYRDAPKGKKWKAALTAVGSFAVGFVAGRAGAGYIAEFVPDAQAGGVDSIEEHNKVNMDDIDKSSTQLQDNQLVGGNDSHHNHLDSHHNHHHNHHDSNAQGPGGEGETDATPPEVTESKITTHILEPGEEYQFGGCRFTETEGYETTIHEGYTAGGEEKYVKVSFLENETGEREDLFVGEKNGVILRERYDDQGNIYESTEIKDGQEQKTEYQYNENCELSEKLLYDSEGSLKGRVEITYNEDGSTEYRHLDGDDNHIKTVIKDSNGIMTEQTNGNNDVVQDDNSRGIADSVVSDGNDANLNDATLKGGENAGEGNNNAVPEGITAEQTNGNNIDNAEIKEGPSDNSQKGGGNAGEGNNNAVPEGITAEQTNGDNIDNAEQVKEGPSDNSQKGGGNAGEGNNNAKPEGITAEQTNGNDDNTEKQSDGKLSEEELAEILKQRMREQGAIDAAYKEHFPDARDVEKLFFTDAVLKIDNQLHGMEAAGQQDTQEYQKLEEKLNGELKKIDMVRDEETGEIMSKGDYTALQEQRQADAQAGTQAAEKADTTKDNNNEGQNNSEGQNFLDKIRALSGRGGGEGGKISGANETQTHGANETQTHGAKNTNIPKNFPIGNARG